MCKHENATVVNWEPILGRNFLGWQCNLCGSLSQNLPVPNDATVENYPSVDEVAFKWWQQRIGITGEMLRD